MARIGKRPIVHGKRHFHNQQGHYVRNRKGRLVNPRRSEEARHFFRRGSHHDPSARG